MSGSSYGTLFKITTWGESHGKGVGVVIDGCPAGLALCEEDIQRFLDRRKPGQSKYTTPRKEEDTALILSGVFEGKTTGCPISLMVENRNQNPKDYSQLADCFRPGHADYCFDQKYGFRDYRGGGRSSGRETIGRVAAGAIAVKILREMGIGIQTYTTAIGDFHIDPLRFDETQISQNPLFMPDRVCAQKAMEFLQDQMHGKNSCGGIVECHVTGLPVGLGEPVFDKLDASLAKAILSIGAVKGFEIGDGFAVSRATGLSNNDAFCLDADGRVTKKTNHSGGTLGGMSDGSPLVLRAAFKPTPSIASVQNTVNRAGEEIKLEVKGRHDPVIVPRAVVVVEAMTAVTLVDLLFANMTSQMDKIKAFYGNQALTER